MNDTLDLDAIRERMKHGVAHWSDLEALLAEVERLRQVGTHYFNEQKRLRKAIAEARSWLHPSARTGERAARMILNDALAEGHR